ncbi:cytochrome d ubiquinol oxidase subunit III [Escherichia coli]|uniref:Z-ring associated protein G n=9 Tax=root TaxID=1 RepID=A0A376LD35_ECOLX|nr:cytochrome d ubiquinol oxidase subunit III [Escherichia coli]
MEPEANTLRKQKTTGDVHDLGICANWVSRRHHYWCCGHAFLGNRKLRQQQALQYELEKNKAELDEYREELVSHFARSAELLDTMAHDYRQLYQHMAKSSSSLLPELSAEANPFRNRLAESEASNDQAPVQMPRDYSEGASGLLRTGAKRD